MESMQIDFQQGQKKQPNRSQRQSHQGHMKSQNRKVNFGENAKEDQRVIDLEKDQELGFTVKVLRE